MKSLLLLPANALRTRAITPAVLDALGRPGVAALVLAVLALLQLGYGAHLPLFGDEAYYWTWSRQLAAGYFDHPPMIAVLLRLASLFGDGELAVRGVPAVCAAVGGWCLHALARDVYGPRTAALTLALYVLIPATQLNALIATPDAPLLMFWTLALLAAQRAVGTGAWRWFVLTGVALGLALLSKYTAVLLGGALLVFVALRRPGWLRRPRVWVAAATAVLLFAPVLWWNARHDWISFAFQYRHGTGQAATVDLGQWAGFLAGLSAIFSPPLFLLAAAACGAPATWREPRRTLLALCTLLPLSVFVWKGLFTKMELNWAAVVFPSATVLAAGYIMEGRRWRWLAASGVMALAASAALKFPVALGLPARLNIHNRLFGERQAIAALLPLRRPGEPLLADHYTTASLLAFYAPGHPHVRIPVPSRFSQYDLRDRDPAPRQGLYLARRPDDGALARQCGTAHLLRAFSVSAPGYLPKTFYFYRCGA
ncbi:glycosyltransferase family 39 protein [Nitrogeniibacter mangrovi]|uniref:Glycosyltransferase family 39 protein n=1 Tax=Nitrogeniibacter mangrovi TaxID=2016596 RepID=A0A6C1B4D8_9RHOO|nr:glycosyltransferase family 39 protein [Nitrogeniibacter mangrovi]QID18303.1 glycosyltransferase family 39 protein [Nitrogeniibacter mangrovi]